MTSIRAHSIAAAIALAAFAAPCALAQLTTFQGNAATEAAWRNAVGGIIPLEDFESYYAVASPFSGPSDQIQTLPALHIDLYGPTPGSYPGVYTNGNQAHSGTNQLCNFGGTIPQFGDYFIVPSAGYTIRALGFWQCDPQGDQTLYIYDAQDNLLGTITGLINNGSGNSFAGFISDVPVAKIRVEGLLGDGYNHIDDLQVVVNSNAPACLLDYNLDGSLNPDDLGDFITDYYTPPPIPGPGGYAIACPENDPPYDAGYKAAYTPDGSGQCNPPFPDNLGDFITDYFGSTC